MENRRLGVVATVIALGLVALGCGSKSKDALAACKAASKKTADGLKVCSEGWKTSAETGEFYDLTSEFDSRLDAACKDSARLKDCDTYCPIRITEPGPRNKSLTLSMCVMKGYGTLDGKLTNAKPKAYSTESFEVIEACVVQCGGRKGADPGSASYKSCFSGCKVTKAAELNKR